MLMLKCLLLLLFGFPLVLMFDQNAYKVIFERTEPGDYNREYLREAKVVNSKYNRTTTVCNITIDILRDFEYELQTEVQAYRFASNEYRLFPIRFGFNFCQFAKTNEFGLGRLFECGNLTGCPINKGKYFMCNWMPEGTKFPPNVPAGRYKVDLKFIFHNALAFNFEFYAEAKYPIVKGDKFF